MNDKYEIYTETKAVVNKLFSQLKFKNWNIGRIIRIIVVMIFTHKVDVQVPSSVDEN